MTLVVATIFYSEKKKEKRWRCTKNKLNLEVTVGAARGGDVDHPRALSPRCRSRATGPRTLAVDNSKGMARPSKSSSAKRCSNTRLPQHRTVSGGLPSVRRQARALERLLKRGSLPDHVRREKQEALRQLSEKAALNKRTERERHFSKKYHKVRFFERLKVEKRIALLRKQVAEASPATRITLEEQLRESEYNMLYIKHFPRHKKYLSLFPSAEGDNPYVAKQRTKIRAMLIRRACNGTLETKERRCASSSKSADGVADADGEVEGGESKDGVEGLDGDQFFAPAPVLLAAPAKRGRG